jgi:hypothetical protein
MLDSARNNYYLFTWWNLAFQRYLHSGVNWTGFHLEPAPAEFHELSVAYKNSRSNLLRF